MGEKKNEEEEETETEDQEEEEKRGETDASHRELLEQLVANYISKNERRRGTQGRGGGKLMFAPMVKGKV